jgi:hypothetical protein
MPDHVVLLGDSIFDNAAYTRGEPDVITHLRRILPRTVTASLLAVDGATTADLGGQLRALPADATHAVVSVGGNDALMNSDILNMRVPSTREALLLFGDREAQFEKNYRTAIGKVHRRIANLTVCTIYNGNLPPDQAPAARVALMIFNDAILRIALELRLGIIDLRPICCEPEDYANPIEPSGTGGAKIARAIASSVVRGL